MALPIKADWNPEPILHSICAFANDIDICKTVKNRIDKRHTVIYSERTMLHVQQTTGIRGGVVRVKT